MPYPSKKYETSEMWTANQYRNSRLHYIFKDSTNYSEMGRVFIPPPSLHHSQDIPSAKPGGPVSTIWVFFCHFKWEYTSCPLLLESCFSCGLVRDFQRFTFLVLPGGHSPPVLSRNFLTDLGFLCSPSEDLVGSCIVVYLQNQKKGEYSAEETLSVSAMI